MSGSGAARGASRAGRLALVGGGVLLALTLATGLAVAASVAASVTLSVSNAEPGDTVTVVAMGLGGAGDVPVLLAGPGTSVQLATAKADASGAFSLKVTIPADTADGDYDIVVFDTAEELIQAPLHVGTPVATDAAATDTTDLGGDTATPPDTAGPGATAAPAPDPYPVPEGIRDVTFILLVAGSLALAAWGVGAGRRP